MLKSVGCARVEAELWDRATGRLPAGKQARVEAHLERCPACRTLAEEYAAAAAAVGSYRATAVPVAPGDWAALRGRLAAGVGASPALARPTLVPALVLAGVALAALFLRPPANRANQGSPAERRGGGASQAAGDRARSASGSGGTGSRILGSGSPVTNAHAHAGASRKPPRAESPKAERSSRPSHATPAAAPGEDRFLDGWDPELMARWMVGSGQDRQALAWLRRGLPPVKDDFVEVPLPRTASGDPKSPAAREAVRQYATEAAVVDSRLFRKVSLQLKAVALEELCAELQSRSQVRFRASRVVQDEKVTLFVKDRPVRELMREVARLFGYRWLREGEEGAYRYELTQELRAQLAEEEMRQRDLHEALIALDGKMAEYRPYLDQPVEQLQQRLETARGAEKEILQRLVRNGCWGAAQVYFRLSAADRNTLLAKGKLYFGSGGPLPGEPLPEEWRLPLLRSSNQAVFGPGTVIDAGSAPDKPHVRVEQLPNTVPMVVLELNRSEAGEVKLVGGTHVYLKTGEEITGAGGYLMGLATGKNPATSRPANAAANAALKRDPVFQPVITLRPKPSCPRVAQDAERARKRESDPYYLGFEADVKNPHVTTADVWQELHERTGLPVLADSYTRLFPASAVALEKASTFDALCKAGDALGVRWQKDGDYVLCRSASFFWDKLKEVPNRLLRRWQEESARPEGLPLRSLLEMVFLNDVQLDSKTVGYGVVHCWGLDEWGIIGGGPLHYNMGIHPEGMRRMARVVTGFSAAQLEAALKPEGLPLTALGSLQREAVLQNFQAWLHGAPPEQLRFRIDYAPKGTYVWEASVTRERYQAGARRWPILTGRSADEVLAQARRYDPAAGPDSVYRTPGKLEFTFIAPNGDRASTGGPRVLAPLE